MRSPIVLVLLAILCGSIGLIRPQPVAACSCAGPATAEAARSSADRVFVGTVRSIRPSILELHEPWPAQFVTFTVDQVWKGPPKSTIQVITRGAGMSCSYGFTAQQAYLVYAHETDGELRARLCSRTQPLGSQAAQADLRVLGAGIVPPPEQPPSVALMVLALLGLVGVAGAVAINRLRRKRA